jgi:hypothetical protein
MFEIRNKSEFSNVQNCSFGHSNFENLSIVSNFGFRASDLGVKQSIKKWQIYRF